MPVLIPNPTVGTIITMTVAKSSLFQSSHRFSQTIYWPHVFAVNRCTFQVNQSLPNGFYHCQSYHRMFEKCICSIGTPWKVSIGQQSYICQCRILQRNGVKHITTSPYLPSSNGLAEWAVQTFKNGLRKTKDGSLRTKLAQFLFFYRTTLQSTTSISPRELLFGQKLKSPLDMHKLYLHHWV